jgi:hypothetical protein
VLITVTAALVAFERVRLPFDLGGRGLPGAVEGISGSTPLGLTR